MIPILVCSLTRYRNAAEAMVAEKTFNRPMRAKWCGRCGAFHVRPHTPKKAEMAR